MPYRIFAFVLFALLSVNLSANDEIKRIDTLVNDIKELRQNYEHQLALKDEKIHTLKEQNRRYKEQLQLLQSQVKSKSKRKMPIQCKKENENPFPPLLLKKAQIIATKASTYRLAKDAPLYGDVKSTQSIDRWEKGTSFTSNMRSTTRIKITGYFVDKVWQKATKELWIDAADVIKRK